MSFESNIERGAPKGNQNAAKGKMFYEALRKALTQDSKKLNDVVDGLIEAAIAREPWAVKELIDRVDGKAIQAIENADGSPLLAGIQVTFVRPDADNI